MLLLVGHHVDPGAFAYVDVAFHFQHDDRFAHHGTADVHLFGNVALGRQLIAHRVSAAFDTLFKLGGQLLIQASGFSEFHSECSLDREGRMAMDLLYHLSGRAASRLRGAPGAMAGLRG